MSRTNFQKIKDMSVEEMAEFLHNMHDYFEDGEPLLNLCLGEDNDIVVGDNFADIKEWLEREVEE